LELAADSCPELCEVLWCRDKVVKIGRLRVAFNQGINLEEAQFIKQLLFNPCFFGIGRSRSEANAVAVTHKVIKLSLFLVKDEVVCFVDD
jgi:hypothetical protein